MWVLCDRVFLSLEEVLNKHVRNELIQTQNSQSFTTGKALDEDVKNYRQKALP